MQRSKIEPAELTREKDVILREFEMGEGEPGRILWKLTQGVRYQAHPARHPTIGYVDEFKKIERDEVYDFYRRMYVPNNLVFVVVGDIERQAVVDQIAKLWSDSAARDLPKLSFPIEPRSNLAARGARRGFDPAPAAAPGLAVDPRQHAGGLRARSARLRPRRR